MSRAHSFILYCNLFLGICAVALCIETDVVFSSGFNSPVFYVLIFCSVVAYYSTVYYRSSLAKSLDGREIWYQKNRKPIKKFLIVLGVIVLVSFLYLFVAQVHYFSQLDLKFFGLLVMFPSLVILYNFGMLPFKSNKDLRHIGWLKPFVLGFAWSGIVTFYPIIFKGNVSEILNSSSTIKIILLWLQNFFITSVIAVSFDIKDFKVDQRSKLNTYPVLIGVRNTVSFIIIPQIFLSLSCLIFYQMAFVPLQIIPFIVKLLPYGLMFFIIARLYRQNYAMFYLITVDGIMFVKALCGITGTLLLKK